MRRRSATQYITPEGYSPFATNGHPLYEWSDDGGAIRMRQGRGWGPWMRFRGERGEVGASPAHAWRGTAVAFQQPDGAWGPFVELRGACYVPEWDGTRLRFVRGQVGPDRTPWRHLEGKRGPRGAMPRHEVIDDGVRFERPDGKWGQVIPIKALDIQGPPGPPPRHEIDQAGHRIRFEQPNGQWGEWLDLGAEDRVVFMGGGAEGTGGGPIPAALPTTNWDPSTGTFPAGSLNGQVYKATGPGTVDGVDFVAGDLITALTNNASTTSYADWTQTPHTHAAVAPTTLTDWAPSSGTFPAGNTKGQQYRATDDGVVDGVQFRTGDLLTGLTANAGTVSYTNWTRTPHDQVLAAALLDFDASAGTFPSSATKGQHYRATTSGTLDGVKVPAGSIVVALVDNPSTTSRADWAILPALDAVTATAETAIPFTGANYQNGLIEFFGKGKDTGGTWSNPATSGAITLTASSHNGATQALEFLVRNDALTSRVETQNLPNSYFRVEFPGALDRVRVDGYNLRSSAFTNRHPINWQIRGSVDGVNWTVIDDRVNDHSLDGLTNGNVHFPATGPGASGWWKFVEILQTGSNFGGFDYLGLSRIEFFGAYREGDAVDTSGLQHAAFDADGNLVPVPEDTAITALPAYAAVTPYKHYLLVEQADNAHNGWWYASPSAGTWVQVQGGVAGGGAGADQWTDLTDTVAAIGQPGDLVAVNAAGDTLTFVDIDGGTF